MKNSVHPQYNPNAQITCNSCKTTWTAGSVLDEIQVEVCSNCHPFYTGQSGTLVDTDNMVDKFLKKSAAADSSKVLRKRQKVAQRGNKSSDYSPEPRVTLKDMMKNLQK